MYNCTFYFWQATNAMLAATTWTQGNLFNISDSTKSKKTTSRSHILETKAPITVPINMHHNPCALKWPMRRFNKPLNCSPKVQWSLAMPRVPYDIQRQASKNLVDIFMRVPAAKISQRGTRKKTWKGKMWERRTKGVFLGEFKLHRPVNFWKNVAAAFKEKICQIAQVKLRWDTNAPSSRKHVLFLTSRVVLSDWRCKCTLQSWMPSPCSRCNMWTINSADALESFAWKKSETAKRRMYPCSRQPVTWSFGLWKLHRSFAWSTELRG